MRHAHRERGGKEATQEGEFLNGRIGKKRKVGATDEREKLACRSSIWQKAVGIAHPSETLAGPAPRMDKKVSLRNVEEGNREKLMGGKCQRKRISHDKKKDYIRSHLA